MPSSALRFGFLGRIDKSIASIDQALKFTIHSVV